MPSTSTRKSRTSAGTLIWWSVERGERSAMPNASPGKNDSATSASPMTTAASPTTANATSKPVCRASRSALSASAMTTTGSPSARTTASVGRTASMREPTTMGTPTQPIRSRFFHGASRSRSRLRLAFGVGRTAVCVAARLADGRVRFATERAGAAAVGVVSSFSFAMEPRARKVGYARSASKVRCTPRQCCLRQVSLPAGGARCLGLSRRQAPGTQPIDAHAARARGRRAAQAASSCVAPGSCQWLRSTPKS